MGKAFIWPNVISLKIAYERHGFDADGYTVNPQNIDHLLVFGGSWEGKRVDNLNEPRHGTLSSISVYRSQELLTGQGFAEFSSKFRAYATQWRTTVAARLYVQIQTSQAPFYKMYYMGGLTALRSYEYPTLRSTSRVLMGLELRNRIYTYTHPLLPFPINFYLTPFAEAGSYGQGDEMTGKYLWGYGLILGMFSTATGFASVDMSYNQAGTLDYHAFVGWAF